MIPQDNVHKAKVQTLLGERGVKADHAVRFRDLIALGLTPDPQAGSIRLGANARSAWRAKASLSRSDFCLAFYREGMLTSAEAIDAARGGCPTTFALYIAQMPGAANATEGQILWAGTTSIERLHPLFEALRAHYAMTPETADDLFGYRPLP